jgi:hypothetical protein
MRIRVLGASLLAVATAGRAYGVESGRSAPPVAVVRSAQHSLESVTVGDTFVVQVRVPASYGGSEKKYPVLYVLDGDKCFGLAADNPHFRPPRCAITRHQGRLREVRECRHEERAGAPPSRTIAPLRGSAALD